MTGIGIHNSAQADDGFATVDLGIRQAFIVGRIMRALVKNDAAIGHDFAAPRIPTHARFNARIRHAAGEALRNLVGRSGAGDFQGLTQCIDRFAPAIRIAETATRPTFACAYALLRRTITARANAAPPRDCPRLLAHRTAFGAPSHFGAKRMNVDNRGYGERHHSQTGGCFCRLQASVVRPFDA